MEGNKIRVNYRVNRDKLREERTVLIQATKVAQLESNHPDKTLKFNSMECLFFSVTGEKMKRILINKSLTDEIRVALVEGAKLYDLDNETSDKNLLKGSIFKARVSRVETSLDAAFVYFGSERHGFLPLKELTSEYFEKDNEGKRKCTLKENDEIIVQVLKEERGTKGAALSTQLSLAGRFLVLIPNSTKGGGV